MKLPSSIDQARFSKAIKEFQRIVGSEWVFTSEEDLDLYRDAYSPYWGEPEERRASAAVAPKSTEEVQAVVRIANQYKIPIYAISTGKNLGYGGSAPAYTGSVVIDLKRMGKILEVNEKQAYCVVEPGVSYFDMYRHLQENKIKLWIDVPDPGWGSMVGNAMDRGAGYTAVQFRNHFDAHCGMEVVLADGSLLRTGMGAMPGSQTWQMYKSGFGPWIDGMFSQSNFGIVTKMGFWLMPEPEAFLKGVVHAPRYRDLGPMVDEMTHLENSRIFTGYPDLNSPVLGTPSLAGLHEFLVNGPPKRDLEYMSLLQRGASAEEYEPYGRKNNIPFWSCAFTFYGPEPVIRAQWAHVQERYRAAIPDVAFEEREFYKLPLSEEQKLKVQYPAQFGIPNLRTFAIGARSLWNPAPPSEGHAWFSPVIPRSGESILKVNEVLGKAARELGIPMVFAMNVPVPSWERSFTFIIPFFITKDPAVNKKNRDAFRKIIRIAAEHGWGEYRTAPAFQDNVMDTYAFNNHALLRFHERVKDAVDPNGILSPGRYGIWPKHLRKDRV
ncbi:p-cresol methylhydroxylase [Burkholderia sp. SG-MS1]|uniref:FAD-binding oxidoreductase n=1 Tax=Paraburkholderia sp. SG-MS1 TaxID=2023741 RepID=UPI0014487321|nr:FAD-binding oxidoreductase [Paraburkholderia sp. SG-MS1]NKJ49049.1 p-cresol methylhydroxylase [Paraburkholderia sp. SG-MS1]